MNSYLSDIEKAEKNVKYLSAVSKLLEPEMAKTVPISKFIPSMAPDTAEWNRRVKCLQFWRVELVGSDFLNLAEKNSVDKSIKQASFQYRKCYRRDKRILLMGMFQDRCITMNSI